MKDKAAQYKSKKHGLTKELALHAETNALRYCSENPEKATVYVTHVPCHDCAKQLVSHRVKRVCYLFWMDNSESSIKLFQDFDVSCIPFPLSSRKAVFRARRFVLIITFVREALKKTYPRKVHSI